MRVKEERLEREFEKKCMDLIKYEDWTGLDSAATEHLEGTTGKSFKGFFYLGVALYKLADYDNGVRAF